MNLRLPRRVISTGPRSAASTTSPDLLLKSVREKCANGISLNGRFSRYHDFSYFSYLWCTDQTRFLVKRNTLENQRSINWLLHRKNPAASNPRMAPRLPVACAGGRL